MRTRMVSVAFGLFTLASLARAAEPPIPLPAFGTDTQPYLYPLPEQPKAATAAKVKTPDAKTMLKTADMEAAAKALDISIADYKSLRELGFADSEIDIQIHEYKRSPRQMVLEREILADVGKAIAEVNPKVHQLPSGKHASERERLLKDALAKIRRDRKTTKEEMRKVLSGTCFFAPDELRRVLGISLFSPDEVRQVMGSRLFGGDKERDDRVTR